MIYLSVDHGTKNIGIAICDELGIAARSLCVVPHISKEADAATIAKLAEENLAEMILVGVSYNEDGDPNDAGRRAINFMATLKAVTPLDVIPWDETLTTQDARAYKIEMGVSKKRRQGHHDSSAAAVLLQDYLDSRIKRNL